MKTNENRLEQIQATENFETSEECMERMNQELIEKNYWESLSPEFRGYMAEIDHMEDDEEEENPGQKLWREHTRYF